MGKVEFAQQLTVNAILTIEDVPTEIPPSCVTYFDCKLHPYGFEAELEWKVTVQGLTGIGDDVFYAAFITQAINKVEITIVMPVSPLEEPQDPFYLYGCVTTKEFAEEPLDDSTMAGITLRYRVKIVDFAQGYWKQNFPCQLFTESAMSEIVEAYIVEPDLNMVQDPIAPFLQADVPQNFIFLPLGTRDNEASFYDFIIWYTRTMGGQFLFDYDLCTYAWAEEKAAADEPSYLEWGQVGGVEVKFPEFPRYNAEIINVSAMSPVTLPVVNEFCAPGGFIVKSVLTRGEVPEVATEMEAIEEAKLNPPREAEVHVHLSNYPELILMPGAYVSFTGQTMISPYSYISEDIFRIRHFNMTLRAQGASDMTAEGEGMNYQVQATVVLESLEDTYAVLPEFWTPRWPAYVEGFVLSVLGEPEDQTWEMDIDPEDGDMTYTVTIPCFEDQPIQIPYIPGTQPGHFFFPPVKEQRVLLAMDFNAATIVSYLDWRIGAEQVVADQGNTIMMGNEPLDSTIISNVTADGIGSTLLIQRKNDADIQTIEVSQSTLTISVFSEEE